MRTKVSEILSSFDYYNRIGDFQDEDELVVATDFVTPDGYKMVEDEGVVDMVKEFFDYKGNTDDFIPSAPEKTKYNYVLTFEEYVKGNPNVHSNFQKRPPQDPDYDDRPRGWREDDLDDDFDDEEE